MAKQIHDRLFRHAFGSEQTAGELALNLLPTDYRRKVQGASVTLDPESFVDSELRGRFSDLLICFTHAGQENGHGVEQAHPGDKGSASSDVVRRDPASVTTYLYVLVEHKAQPYRWVALQVLTYILAVHNRVLRDNKELTQLPEVIPIILYNGSNKWNYPLEFQSLVEGGGEGVAHIPRFTPLFADLGAIDDEAFHGGVRTLVGLLFLKYLSRRITEDVADTLLDTMHLEPITPELQRFYQPFYTALLETKEAEEIEIMVAGAKRRRYSDSEEELMTYAEKMRTEGQKIGRQEGRVQEKQEVLVRQLSRKFAVTEADRWRIEETEDTELLDAALDEVVTAESKKQVLSKHSG